MREPAKCTTPINKNMQPEEGTGVGCWESLLQGGRNLKSDGRWTRCMRSHHRWFHLYRFPSIDMSESQIQIGGFQELTTRLKVRSDDLRGPGFSLEVIKTWTWPRCHCTAVGIGYPLLDPCTTVWSRMLNAPSYAAHFAEINPLLRSHSP